MTKRFSRNALSYSVTVDGPRVMGHIGTDGLDDDGREAHAGFSGIFLGLCIGLAIWIVVAVAIFILKWR
jgi:hypothetical protein